jgi:hypothetical protein
MPPPLFNPLDKSNLGKSVIDALMATEAVPLAGLARFSGAGVYAIYYGGAFPPYRKLAALNRGAQIHPIYIGKGIPRGGRKGLTMDASADSFALYERLSEHADSIQATTDLEVADFQCRHLAVDDIWIGLGETLLIQKYAPLWNQVVEGFGNHDPGAGRHKGKRPLWHELHAGSGWAKKCSQAKLNREEILEKVAAYMAALPSAQSAPGRTHK